MADVVKTSFFTLLICFNSLVPPLTTPKIVATSTCHCSDLRTSENSATEMGVLFS